MHLRTLKMVYILCLIGCGAAWGQTPDSADEDPLGPPTTRGTRLTPGMARAIAQGLTRNVLVRRYELDQARADEAAELVARRLMSTAHALDVQAAALAELMITRVCEAQAQKAGGAHPRDIFTPEFQKEMADQVLPTLPAVRDLMGGIVRDTMPMLPFKQQLKITGELAAAGTALNGFEQTLQRWARGEGIPGEDPFSPAAPADSPAAKDSSGQSAALKSARAAAEKELDQREFIRRLWENYLKEFKRFYALDESQCATADTVLREYLERANVLMQDQNWRDQIYRSRLWLRMAPSLKLTGVFTNILNSRYEEAMAPINALGDDFRLRLEAIPVDAQKAAAQARIAAALKERGYQMPEAN